MSEGKAKQLSVGAAVGNLLLTYVVGSSASAITKSITAPFNTVKAVRQAQIFQVGGDHWGYFEAFRQITSRHGILALWRGHLFNVLRLYPTRILNFVLANSMRRLLGPAPNAAPSAKLPRLLLAGAASGTLALALSYPLDLVHILLITDVGPTRKYSGMWDCIKTVVSKDGVFGLYSGAICAALGTVAYRTVYFTLYDSFRPNRTPGLQGVLKSFLFSQALVIVAGMAAFPFETIQREMIHQAGGERKYDNSFDCARKIVKEYGILSLWHGFPSYLINTFLSTAVLIIYDQTKAAFSRR